MTNPETLRKRSTLAAMKYLANKQPGKYRMSMKTQTREDYDIMGDLIGYKIGVDYTLEEHEYKYTSPESHKHWIWTSIQKVTM